MFDRTTPGLYPERKQDLTKAAVTPTRKIPRRTITKRQSLTHRHQRQERHRRQEEAVPMEEWERTPHNHDNDDEGTSSMMMTATTGNLPVPHRSWCWVGSEGTTRRQRGLFSSWDIFVVGGPGQFKDRESSRTFLVPFLSLSTPRMVVGEWSPLLCGQGTVYCSVLWGREGVSPTVRTPSWELHTTKTATVRSGLR